MDIEYYTKKLQTANETLQSTRKAYKEAKQYEINREANQLLNIDWKKINEERIAADLPKIGNAEQRKAYTTALNQENQTKLSNLQIDYQNAETEYETIQVIIELNKEI